MTFEKALARWAADKLGCQASELRDVAIAIETESDHPRHDGPVVSVTVSWVDAEVVVTVFAPIERLPVVLAEIWEHQ